MERQTLMDHLQEHGMCCFKLLEKQYGCTRGVYDAALLALKQSHHVRHMTHMLPTNVEVRVHYVLKPRKTDANRYCRMLDKELGVRTHSELSGTPDVVRNWLLGRSSTV